jgi:diaminohydroxyphosphoribosylaminopyrimidine deaminase/5-amino-6-(5-phosphoribosylamino)uracil reductase
LLEQETPILWCVDKNSCFSADAETISALSHVEVFKLSDRSGLSELQQIMFRLSELQCNEVLVEAGATLAGSFIEERLWDELVIYMAPKLLGSSARPLAEIGLSKMSQSIDLTLSDVRQVGDDIRMTYIPIAGP